MKFVVEWRELSRYIKLIILGLASKTGLTSTVAFTFRYLIALKQLGFLTLNDHPLFLCSTIWACLSYIYLVKKKGPLKRVGLQIQQAPGRKMATLYGNAPLSRDTISLIWSFQKVLLVFIFPLQAPLKLPFNFSLTYYHSQMVSTSHYIDSWLLRGFIFNLHCLRSLFFIYAFYGFKQISSRRILNIFDPHRSLVCMYRGEIFTSHSFVYFYLAFVIGSMKLYIVISVFIYSLYCDCYCWSFKILRDYTGSIIIQFFSFCVIGGLGGYITP